MFLLLTVVHAKPMLVEIPMPAEPFAGLGSEVPVHRIQPVGDRPGRPDKTGVSSDPAVSCDRTAGRVQVRVGGDAASWPELPLRASCRVGRDRFDVHARPMNPAVDMSSQPHTLDDGVARLARPVGWMVMFGFDTRHEPMLVSDQVNATLPGVTCTANPGSPTVTVSARPDATMGQGVCPLRRQDGSVWLLRLALSEGPLYAKDETGR